MELFPANENQSAVSSDVWSRVRQIGEPDIQ